MICSKGNKRSISTAQVGSKHTALKWKKLKMDLLGWQGFHVDSLSPSISSDKHIFVCPFCAIHRTRLIWMTK